MKLKVFCFIVMILSAKVHAGTEMKLPHCGNSPNCVSTQGNPLDKEHYIAPFKICDTPAAAWLALKKVIKNQDRMSITHETDQSLHAIAISLVFSFVDDIDIILDNKAGLIHIRSASRIGHSDFGVNRRRIQSIYNQLKKLKIVQ